MPGNVSAERKALVVAYGARDRLQRCRRGIRRCDPPRARARRAGSRRLFLPRPVLQPGQPARTLRGHRASRSCEQIAEQAHAFHRRARHDRHVRRHLTPAQRARPFHPYDRGRTGGRLPRPGRPEAPADRHRADDLGPRPRPTRSGERRPSRRTTSRASWPAPRACWSATPAARPCGRCGSSRRRSAKAWW